MREAVNSLADKVLDLEARKSLAIIPHFREYVDAIAEELELSAAT